jgi:ornithine--oxo-acid transaminase
LACAVAITSLEVLKEEGLAENAEVLGNLLRDELKKLNSPHIKMVRGKGLLNAIIIDHAEEDAAWKLCIELMKNGLIAKPTHGDIIRFAPPLIITKDEILDCVKIIETSLKILD